MVFRKKLNLLTNLCPKSSPEKYIQQKMPNLIWFKEKSKPLNGCLPRNSSFDFIEVIPGNQLARHAQMYAVGVF